MRGTMGWIVAIALLLLIAVFGIKRYDFYEPWDVAWLKGTPIAHRGLHTAEYDENSMGAFSSAVDHGYAIELDVRLSEDSAVVVMHDNDLKRLFNVDNSVSKMTLAELKELRFPKSGETIPTLAEVLARVDGRTPILIEIKNMGPAGKLEEETLKILAGYEGEYAFQSFGPLSVRWMREHDESTPTGLLLTDFPLMGNRLLRNFKDNLFSAICRPSFVAYDYTAITGEVTRGYRGSGVTVLGWTVNDDVLEDKSYLERVDNVIFELKSP